MARLVLFAGVLLVAGALLSACGPEASTPSSSSPSPSGGSSGAGAGSDPAAPTIPWGDAAGALRIGIQAPKARYAEGETLVLTVRAENCGREPMTLAHFEDENWWYRVVFQNLAGGASFEARNVEEVDFAEPPDLELPPGEVWTKTFDVGGRARLLQLGSGGGSDYLTSLPAGRYDAVIEYTHRERGAEGYWVGRAWSNVITVVVE